MKIRYINSACLQIEIRGINILSDPWFTDGAFNGSWFKITALNPFKYIKKPSLVYISHIHPDHYDPIFLRKLERKFGGFDIVIPNSKNNYLNRKALRDGFITKPVDYYQIDGLHIHIIENDTGSISDIDSAMFIYDERSNLSMLNLNDCIYNPNHEKQIKKIINKYTNRLNLLAVGYSGASSYPQRYFDLDKEKQKLIEQTNIKIKTTLNRYKKFTRIFQADHNLPFAGEYLLGGKLAKYNKWRGIPDALETRSFDKKAVILEHGGSIDLANSVIRHERTKKLDRDLLNHRIKQISDNKLDYEKDFNFNETDVNFVLMLRKSLKNALHKSEIKGKFNLVISILSNEEVVERYLIATHKNQITPLDKAMKTPKRNTTEIKLDFRLLFGLLSGFYHWNNIDLGSQFQTIRSSNESFSYEKQNFLNFFNM